MAKLPPLPDLKAPWFYAEKPEDLYYNVVIGLEGTGFVSISFNLRRWELGYNSTGFIFPRRKGPNPYEGRGWRDKLVQDAMNALSQAAKDHR